MAVTRCRRGLEWTRKSHLNATKDSGYRAAKLGSVNGVDNGVARKHPVQVTWTIIFTLLNKIHKFISRKGDNLGYKFNSLLYLTHITVEQQGIHNVSMAVH